MLGKETFDVNAIDYFQQVTRYFLDAGMDLTVRYDMEAWAAHMQEVNPWHVSPTHNPKFNTLSPENSFWLCLKRGEKIVACTAHRTFNGASLSELIRSNRLWYSDLRSVHSFDIIDQRSVDEIMGCVSLVGGLWVAENLRDKTIGTCLAQMSRFIGVLNYGSDWHIAIIKRQNAERGKGKGYLEHQILTPLMNGFYPPTDMVMELFLARMSRMQVVGMSERHVWPAVLRADGDEQTIGGIGAVGRIRQNQAGVLLAPESEDVAVVIAAQDTGQDRL
jgi:hypothetical protein